MFFIPHSHRSMPIIPFGERESGEVSLVIEAKKRRERGSLHDLTYNIFLILFYKKGLKH